MKLDTRHTIGILGDAWASVLENIICKDPSDDKNADSTPKLVSFKLEHTVLMTVDAAAKRRPTTEMVLKWNAGGANKVIVTETLVALATLLDKVSHGAVASDF